MSKHLRSCVTCARHIRITETACPFCKTVVSAERMTPPPRGTPAARLGRAFAVSTFAAAAGTLGSTAACGDSPQVISTADAYGTVPFEAGVGNDTGGPDVITAADAYGKAPVEASDDAPDVITAADAYGTAPREASVEGGDDAPDVITAGDAYGTVEPPEAGQPDVIGGGAAYGVAEPPDGGFGM